MSEHRKIGTGTGYRKVDPEKVRSALGAEERIMRPAKKIDPGENILQTSNRLADRLQQWIDYAESLERTLANRDRERMSVEPPKEKPIHRNELGDLSRFDDLPRGPWKEVGEGQYIWDADDQTILQVRGWGHLHNQFGKEEAVRIQALIGKSAAAIPDLIAALKELRIENELLRAQKNAAAVLLQCCYESNAQDALDILEGADGQQ